MTMELERLLVRYFQALDAEVAASIEFNRRLQAGETLMTTTGGRSDSSIILAEIRKYLESQPK